MMIFEPETRRKLRDETIQVSGGRHFMKTKEQVERP